MCTTNPIYPYYEITSAFYRNGPDESPTDVAQRVARRWSIYRMQESPDGTNGDDIATECRLSMYQWPGLRLRSRLREDSCEMLRPRGRLRFSSRSLEREREL